MVFSSLYVTAVATPYTKPVIPNYDNMSCLYVHTELHMAIGRGEMNGSGWTWTRLSSVMQARNCLARMILAVNFLGRWEGLS